MMIFEGGFYSSGDVESPDDAGDIVGRFKTA